MAFCVRRDAMGLESCNDSDNMLGHSNISAVRKGHSTRFFLDPPYKCMNSLSGSPRGGCRRMYKLANSIGNMSIHSQIA